MGRPLSIKEAAKVKGVSQDRVRRAITNGLLKYEKGVRTMRHFIDSDELERWDGELRPQEKGWKPFIQLVHKYKVNYDGVYRKLRRGRIDFLKIRGHVFVKEEDFVTLLSTAGLLTPERAALYFD